MALMRRRGTHIADVKARGVAAVAVALGLRSMHNRTLGPCPACGEERRSKHEPRGPIGLRPDDQGWTCHRCKVTGDAFTLAAYVVLGHAGRGSGAADWQGVIARCAAVGLCDSLGHDATTPRRQYTPPPPPKPLEPPTRPPPDEVAHTWDSAVGVTEDAEVRAYLLSRFDAADVRVFQQLDLVRALTAAPPWARAGGSSWLDTGHRLISRLYDHRGVVRSLHARTVTSATPKGLSPTGYQVRGLVLADPTAALLLAHQVWAPRCLVITEGVPDFLTWAVQTYRHQPDDAVVGVVSGSWTLELASRLADRQVVVMRGHEDAAGDHYLAAVAATLTPRCDVRSFQAPLERVTLASRRQDAKT